MTEDLRNKLDGELDGALDLLDRQLVDADERLLGKVDDVELIETDDGLTITALLTGQVALLHRLGGRLGDDLVTKYVELRPAESRRDRPWRIPIEHMARLDSAVRLDVRRDEVLRRDTEGHRLGRLTGMEVLLPDGTKVGRVLDARFARTSSGRHALTGLLVGQGHPGSLLGYDRHPRQGPSAIRVVVRWIHRHSRLVPAAEASILWNREQVQLTGHPDQLGTRPSGRGGEGRRDDVG